MRKVIFIALSLLSVICYGQGIKISALPQAGSLIGNELTPIVQNGITKKTSVQSIANLGGVSGTFVDSIFQDGDSIKYTIGSEEYSFYNLPTGGGTTIDTSNFWNIHGNSGTNPATDFIGTTDYKDLRLKRNGNTNIEISSDNKGEHVYIMDSLGNKLFESTSMNGDFSANLGSDTTYVVADNGGGELDISSSTTVIHHPNGGACKMVTQCDSIFNDSDTLTYLGTETYRYKEVNTYNANVTGSFKYANGTQAAGKVLTSDANGFGTWQNISGWNIHGNSGTNPATDFIGTTDNVDLYIKRNSIIAGSFSTGGAFIFGDLLGLGEKQKFGITGGVASLQMRRRFEVLDTTTTVLFKVDKANNRIQLGLNTLPLTDTGYSIGSSSFRLKEVRALRGYFDVVGTTDTNRLSFVVNNRNVADFDEYNMFLHGGDILVSDGGTNTVDINQQTISIIQSGVALNIETNSLSKTGEFSIDIDSLYIINGSQGTGKVLTSDANGLAYWGSQILTDTATLDFGNILANGHEVKTITVTGAALSDVVSLGIPNVSMNAHASFVAWVSASDTVSVKCFNFDGSSFDPASGLFKIKVFK